MDKRHQFIDRLRLRHLRLLELIDDQVSLRAISEILHLSQPALSQMVKDLEKAFATPLIDRSSKGVALNQAGRLALQRVRLVLSTINHLTDELLTHEAVKLRIGTNPALLHDIFPEAFARLPAAEPKVCHTILLGGELVMVQALEDGEIDCYVGVIDWNHFSAATKRNLAYEPLCETKRSIACSPDHPLAGRSDLTARDLLSCRWLLQPESSFIRRSLNNAFRHAGLPELVPDVEVGADPVALMQMAARTDMLICVPEPALTSASNAIPLCRLVIPDLAIASAVIHFVTVRDGLGFQPIRELRQSLREASALLAEQT